MRREAFVHMRLKLFEGPVRSGYTDNRNVQVAALQHRLQCGENFLVGQIAGGTKENQGVRTKITHGKSPLSHGQPFAGTGDVRGERDLVCVWVDGDPFPNGAAIRETRPLSTSFLTCLPQSTQ